MDFLAKLLLALSIVDATLILGAPDGGESEVEQSVDVPPSPPSPSLRRQIVQPRSQPPANGLRVHPIILVPGDGGSQIEAKLNKSQVSSFYMNNTIQ